MALRASNKFGYRPRVGAAVLASMSIAPDGACNLLSDDFAQGAMATLVNAELLAAQHGLVPSVPMPDGSPGVLIKTVGLARDRLKDAPEQVAVAYLVAQNAVRMAHLNAGRAADGQGFILRPGGSFEPTIAPVVVGAIVVVVLGLAAVIAHEYGTFATETAKAQILVNGENLRKISLANGVLAHAASGLPLDANSAKVLGDIAESEKKFNDGGFPWGLALGGVAIVGGGYLAIRVARNLSRGRR